MKTDKEQELWLLEMATQQAADSNRLDESVASKLETAFARSQKFAVWATIAAIGVTTASLVSGT